MLARQLANLRQEFAKRGEDVGDVYDVPAAMGTVKQHTPYIRVCLGIVVLACCLQVHAVRTRS
eukprot:6195416-Pleurochrysis_carterae.AAC.1